jgi:hypothetical protein
MSRTEDKRASMPDNLPHPGITMHRLRVGAGMAGFIVVAGFLVIGLIGVPMFRYFWEWRSSWARWWRPDSTSSAAGDAHDRRTSSLAR